MACPKCGNRDGDRAKARVAYGHKTATFLGYTCLVCGCEWDSSPGMALVEFDPPSRRDVPPSLD